MDINGYAYISGIANIISAAPPEDFQGKVLRVFNWGVNGSALVINNQATALAMVEQSDILRSFHCRELADVLVPPGLTFFEQAAYASVVLHRKGGYNEDLKRLTIAASLAKGKLHDDHLFNRR